MFSLKLEQDNSLVHLGKDYTVILQHNFQLVLMLVVLLLANNKVKYQWHYLLELKHQLDIK
jgi:hypothetical protein